MTCYLTLLSLSIFMVLPISLSVFALKRELVVANHSLTFSTIKICDYDSMPVISLNGSLYSWDKQVIFGSLPRMNYISCSQSIANDGEVGSFLISIFQVGVKTNEIGSLLYKISNNGAVPLQWNPFSQIEGYEIYRVQFSQQRFSIKILNQVLVCSEIHIYQIADLKLVTILKFSVLQEYFKMDAFGSLLIMSPQQQLTIHYGSMYEKTKTIDLSYPQLRIEMLEQHNFNHTIQNTSKIIVYYAMSDNKMARTIYIHYKQNQINVTLSQPIFKQGFFLQTHCGDRIFETDYQRKCLLENKECVIPQTDFGSLICIQQNWVGNGKVKFVSFSAQVGEKGISTVVKEYQQMDQSRQGSRWVLIIVIIGIVLIVIIVVIIYKFVIKRRLRKRQKVSRQQAGEEDNYSQLSQ